MWSLPNTTSRPTHTLLNLNLGNHEKKLKRILLYRFGNWRLFTTCVASYHRLYSLSILRPELCLFMESNLEFPGIHEPIFVAVSYWKFGLVLFLFESGALFSYARNHFWYVTVCTLHDLRQSRSLILTFRLGAK